MPSQLRGDLLVAVGAEAHLEHLAAGVLADEGGRGALGHDLALVDDDEAVAQLLGLIHVVRGEDEGRAALLEAEQAVPQDVARLRVEPGGRLVEQQDAGVVDEAARDREAALHAAGELVDLALGLVSQLREVEQLVGLLRADLAGQAEVAAVDVEVLAGVELTVEVVLLRHDPQAGADLGPMVVGIEAEDAQTPARAGRDGADHLHRRGLARAVRAEQAERLPRRDLERQAVDREEVGLALDLVGLDEVLGFDHGGRHRTTLTPPSDAHRGRRGGPRGDRR